MWALFDSTLGEPFPAMLCLIGGVFCKRHRDGQGVRNVCPRDENSLRTPLLIGIIQALRRGNVFAWSLDVNRRYVALLPG